MSVKELQQYCFELGFISCLQFLDTWQKIKIVSHKLCRKTLNPLYSVMLHNGEIELGIRS